MEPIEIFKSIRDVCNEVIAALESEDEKAIDAALGVFMVTMLKLDALK